jgi:hypothetical protein
MADRSRRLRNVLGALILTMAVGGLLSFVLVTDVAVAPAAADESTELQDQGRIAIDTWIEALASGDPAKVKALSAPEFQIVRGDGSAHRLDDYLAELPVFKEIPTPENLVVTATGDQMVARYTIDAVKDVEGRIVNAVGFRLTVFRKQGDVWLVVAHSNFSPVVQE